MKWNFKIFHDFEDFQVVHDFVGFRKFFITSMNHTRSMLEFYQIRVQRAQYLQHFWVNSWQRTPILRLCMQKVSNFYSSAPEENSYYPHWRTCWSSQLHEYNKPMNCLLKAIFLPDMLLTLFEQSRLQVINNSVMQRCSIYSACWGDRVQSGIT